MFGVPATDDGEHFRLLDRALGVGRSHLELKEQRAFENGTSDTGKRPARRTHGNHEWSYGVDTISPAVSDEEVLPVEGPDRLFGSDAEYAERAEHDRLQAEALANPARRIGTNRSALITEACAVITGQWLDCGAPALGDFWSGETWDTPAQDDTSRLGEPLTPPPTPDVSRLAEKLALDWCQASGTLCIPNKVKTQCERKAQYTVITRGYLCTPGPEGLVFIDNDDTDASDEEELHGAVTCRSRSGGGWMWCGDHTVNPSTKYAAEFATRRLTPPGSVSGGVLDVVRRPHRKPLDQICR